MLRDRRSGPGARPVLCLLFLLTSACASSGGPPPAARVDAAAPFAGRWAFDERATAEATSRSGGSRGSLAERAEDLSFDVLRAGASGGAAASGSPQGIRTTMLVVGLTPDPIEIVPDGSTFSVGLDGGDLWPVPLDGGWVEVNSPQGQLEVRLRWENDLPTLERRIDGGGTIRDELTIITSGHLVITRQLAWGREASPVGRLLFRRSS